jgi:hypothetical protein
MSLSIVNGDYGVFATQFRISYYNMIKNHKKKTL